MMIKILIFAEGRKEKIGIQKKAEYCYTTLHYQTLAESYFHSVHSRGKIKKVPKNSI